MQNLWQLWSVTHKVVSQSHFSSESAFVFEALVSDALSYSLNFNVCLGGSMHPDLRVLHQLPTLYVCLPLLQSLDPPPEGFHCNALERLFLSLDTRKNSKEW